MTFPNGMPLNEDDYWAALDEMAQPPATEADRHRDWHRENGMAGCPWDCAASEAYMHQHDGELDEVDGETGGPAVGSPSGNEGQALVEPPATRDGYDWPPDVEPPF